MSDNPLRLLHGYGQSVWLDFVRRSLIVDGGLARLIDHDGVRGVTSNPAIFEKAIGGSADYDSAAQALMAKGDYSVVDLYERLAIEDIQGAADALAPVYQASERRDGYISLEVSPYLALETEGTIEEAKRLWAAVGRDNLMVKAPGTAAGVPAIRALIGLGININVTLLFAQSAYEAVAEAYLAGLEDFAASGGDLSGVASVARFFVSRIDSVIDGEIDRRLKAGAAAHEADLKRVRGKVAIANAKLAYQYYLRLIESPRWQALAAKGAQPQRLLWASTGTKNPDYSDVLYVEELIGPDTVNTMPPATMDAFRDHGRLRQSLTENIAEAREILALTERLGLDLGKVTSQLVTDGVQLFVDAADQLLGAVARKRAGLLGDRLNAQEITLPTALGTALKNATLEWRQAGNIRRLWAKDASLWTGGDEGNWLNWLNVIGIQLESVDQLKAFQAEVRSRGFSHILLLGMGGSSLGPEVLALIIGHAPGLPELLVLDSTDPSQILAFERRIDLGNTLFIVSSKSGTTLEPNILLAYFYDRARATLGEKEAPGRFVAVTDPGSQLERHAKDERFAHVFYGDKKIGGRYSVLSNFGLVPAAAMGLDLGQFLERSRIMARTCGPDVPPVDNPGVQLGLALGLAHEQGRDKLTILASPSLRAIGGWMEQLIAESTGKNGKGLIPVDLEPLGELSAYGDDRLFVHLTLDGDADDEQTRAIDALERHGHPIVRIRLKDPLQLGQEFFRWEIATAVAGAVIGIHPFDQPDVEASKIKTRELTDAVERTGQLPAEQAIFQTDDLALFADPRNAADLAAACDQESLDAYLAAHFRRVKPGDYVGLLAYIEQSPAHEAALGRLRAMARDAYGAATCVGFGPRFLHSTGQAYKGGPNSGVFLQITCDHPADLQAPGRKYSFNTVEAAQARGDFDVLAERGRRLLRVHLRGDVGAGLAGLEASLRRALFG
jgi:transaldolase/glucose-6-phosphate isomerase